MTEGRSQFQRFCFLAVLLCTVAASNGVYGASGDLDTSFHLGSGYATKAFDVGGSDGDFVTSALIQANGDIVLVGYGQNGTSSTEIAMTRLLPDGTLDSTFGSGGSVLVLPGAAYTNAFVTGAVLDSGDGIYIAGSTAAATALSVISRQTDSSTAGSHLRASTSTASIRSLGLPWITRASQSPSDSMGRSAHRS